jgi:hypothetical protein
VVQNEHTNIVIEGLETLPNETVGARADLAHNLPA